MRDIWKCLYQWAIQKSDCYLALNISAIFILNPTSNSMSKLYCNAKYMIENTTLDEIYSLALCYLK